MEEKASKFIEGLYNQRLDKFNDIEFRNLVDRSVEQVLNCNTLFELIQNADDVDLNVDDVQVKIHLSKGNLIFSHNGKKFTEEDVKGIVRIAYGNKQNNPDSTGFMGIGFKSVFAFSDSVTITSAPYSFSFDEKLFKEKEPKLEEVHSYWYGFPILKKMNTSLPKNKVFFELRLTGKEETKQIKEYMGDVTRAPQMLLFLKHIKTLAIVDEDKITRISSEKVDNITTKYGEHSRIKINVNADVQCWEVWTKKICIPLDEFSNKDIHPKFRKLKEKKAAFEIKMAVQVHKNWKLANVEKDKMVKIIPNSIYCTLPTRENIKLPFLINGIFSLDLTRDHLHVSKWNTEIFRQAGLLYANIFLHVFARGDDFSELKMPTELPKPFYDAFLQSVQHRLSTIGWLDCRDKTTRSAREVKFDLVGILSWLGDDANSALENYSINNWVSIPLERQGKLYNVLKNSIKIKSNAYTEHDLISSMKHDASFIKYISQSEGINQKFIEYLENYRSNSNLQVMLDSDKGLKGVSFVLCQVNNKFCLKKPGEVRWPPDDSVKSLEVVQSSSILNYAHLLKAQTKEWLESYGVKQFDKVIIANAMQEKLTSKQPEEISKNYIENLCQYYEKIKRNKEYKKPSSLYLWTNKGSQLSSDIYFPNHGIKLFIIDDLFFLDMQPEQMPKSKKYFEVIGVRSLQLDEVLRIALREFNYHSDKQKIDSLKWMLENEKQLVKSFLKSSTLKGDKLTSVIKRYKPEAVQLPYASNQQTESSKLFINPDKLPIDSINQYLKFQFVSEPFLEQLPSKAEKLFIALGVTKLTYALIFKRLFNGLCDQNTAPEAIIVLTQWWFDHQENMPDNSQPLKGIRVLTDKPNGSLANPVCLGEFYKSTSFLVKHIPTLTYLSKKYVRNEGRIQEWAIFFENKVGVNSLKPHDILVRFLESFNSYSSKVKIEGLKWMAENEKQLVKSFLKSSTLKVDKLTSIIKRYKPEAVQLPYASNQQSESGNLFINPDKLPIDSINQHLKFQFVSKDFLDKLTPKAEKLFIALGVTKLTYALIFKRLFNGLCDQNTAPEAIIVLTQWWFDQQENMPDNSQPLKGIRVLTDKPNGYLASTVYLGECYQSISSLSLVKHIPTLTYLSKKYVRNEGRIQEWAIFFENKVGVNSLKPHDILVRFLQSFNSYSSKVKIEGLKWMAENEKQLEKSFLKSSTLTGDKLTSIIKRYKPEAVQLPYASNQQSESGNLFINPDKLPMDSINQHLKFQFVSKDFLDKLTPKAEKLFIALGVTKLTYALIFKRLFDGLCDQNTTPEAIIVLTQWWFDQQENIPDDSQDFKNINIVTTESKVCSSRSVYLSDFYKSVSPLEKCISGLTYLNQCYVREQDDKKKWAEFFSCRVGVESLKSKKMLELFLKGFNDYADEHKIAGLNWMAEKEQQIVASFSHSSTLKGDNLISIIKRYKPEAVQLPHASNQQTESSKLFINPDKLPIDSINQHLKFQFVSKDFLDKLAPKAVDFLIDLGVKKLSYTAIFSCLFKELCDQNTAPEAIIVLTQWWFDHKEEKASKKYDIKEIKVVSTNKTLYSPTAVYFSDAYGPELSLEKYLSKLPCLNESYIREQVNIQSWKVFFLDAGVSEALAPRKISIVHTDKMNKYSTIFASYINKLLKLFSHKTYNLQIIPHIELIIEELSQEQIYNLFWKFVNENIGMLSRYQSNHDSDTGHFPSYLQFLILNHACVKTIGKNSLVKTDKVYTPKIQELVKVFAGMGASMKYDFFDVTKFQFPEKVYVSLKFQHQLTDEDIDSIHQCIIKGVEQKTKLPSDFFNAGVKFCLHLKLFKQHEAVAEGIMKKLDPFFKGMNLAAKFNSESLEKLAKLTSEELDELLLNHQAPTLNKLPLNHRFPALKNITSSNNDNKIVHKLDDGSEINSLGHIKHPSISDSSLGINDYVSSKNFFNQDKIKESGRRGERKTFEILKEHYRNKKNCTLKDTETGFKAEYSKRGNSKQHIKLNVEWPDKHSDKGLPYDFIITKNDGGKQYYELKSTVGSATEPFFLSVLQWKFMFSKPKKFHLLRLENANALKPQLYKIKTLFNHVSSLNIQRLDYQKNEKLKIQLDPGVISNINVTKKY